MRNALFLLLLPLLVAGTATSQPVTLTLEKSVQIAIDKNLSVIQARNNFAAQQYGVTAATGGLLPSFGASASFSRNQAWTPSGVSIQGGQYVKYGGYSPSNQYSTGVSGSYVLFNGFANTSNISYARSNANASEYTLDRTQQTTVNQTHVSFLNIFRTYELMKVSNDNLERDKKQLERIVESNKVGALALADVYRQQAQVGADEFALIQAQSNHEKAKADMIAFLGVDIGMEYTFDFSGIPSDIDTTEFAPLNATYSDYQNLVSTAIAKRPDYRGSIETLNSAEASVTMARASYMPTITASGSFGYSGFDYLSGSNYLTDNRALSFGFNASLPIFNGFSRENQVEQAQVGRMNAEQQVKQNERQVRVDVRKALLDLEAAEKEVRVSQTTITSALMDRQIAEEKYNLGSGTLLDLLTASANYTTAVSNKVSGVVDYLTAKKQMEYVLGVIVR